MKFSDEFHDFQKLLNKMLSNHTKLLQARDFDLEVDFDYLISSYEESYRLVKKKFAEVLEVAVKKV